MIRSTPSRMLAALAWLVLALTPMHGAPAAGVDAMSRVNHAVVAAHAVAHIDQPAVAAGDIGCCERPGSGGRAPYDACPCASLCASAVPAASVTRLMRVAPDVPLVAARRIDAPRGVHSRLLRPPTV